MPTGGVDPSEANLTEWFKAGVTCVGMGSQLISSEIIKNKEYNKLEQDVRNAIVLIQKLKQLYPVKL
jgi:2-dehydro-3-deoxyphosphogluconate aldolase/(4S)-4-hydroxy-2-oxoglutarate aldolase